MEDFQGLKIIKSVKQICLEKYPTAFNPSILKTSFGLILSFRYCPDIEKAPHISYIGIVMLDDNFNPTSEPELLTTRHKNSKTPSQSEDARLFAYRDRLFLIYNDNIDKIAINHWQRRDMYLAELFYENGHFSLSTPLKLIHESKYNLKQVQKNWVAFEWDKKLLLSYTVNPHEILFPNLVTGSCYQCYETCIPIEWNLGTLRLSTPPLMVDGEYLAFFHSGKILSSAASNHQNIWHYFMGAYTFSADPPFKLNKITPLPLLHEQFYTQSSHEKRVIFPGGFITSGTDIHIVYGKDDCEIWIASIDKHTLKKCMVSLKEETFTGVKSNN